ncbi:MAG TPA: MMPL family transporter [Actinokineospora sp.]|nr:MMPL family transporter [Actinokineospora sp.]
MFGWWGRVVSKFRWLIVVLSIGFTGFAGVWGTGVFDALAGDSSLDDPSSESQQIFQRIYDEFGRQSTDLIALYSSDTSTADDPAFRDSVSAVATKLRGNPSVSLVTSYYETKAPSLVSNDQHSTFLAIRLKPGTWNRDVTALRGELDAVGLTTEVGGPRAIDIDINDQIGEDIPRAEMIAMPILLLLLILVFGNLVAGVMPVLIGAVAILGAFTVVRVITMFTDVSMFSINIITILGLGLAVDYGLFIVSRFREELDRGHPVDVAVSRTVASAGRTVMVSGLLVGLALSSLLIFPQVFLRSMGFGGAAAVVVAMVTSLTLLPALLSILGHRIDALRLPWSRRRGVPTVTGALAHATDGGWWAKIAGAVMRKPVVFTVAVSALLLLIAAPFAGVRFGGVDERMLPEGTESRVVSERLAADFPNGGLTPIRIFVGNASSADSEDFARRVDDVPGVTSVAVTASKPNTTVMSATFDGQANSEEARQIVERVRALERPAGAEVLVGGASASVVDQLDSLGSRLPWMALLVAGITFLLLALAFGSLVVPLKAIVMNLVSIGAAFGVVTWIFQDGHLSGLLNFTPTGYVEASQPILMVAVLFGLSMDYEVFLLSRVRERYDVLGDNTAAVAGGVQRTGAIITAAAALLCVVVGAFATSGITFIKMIGVGMLVALLVDATLVRLLLVPATMRLLGKHNWWAPAPLRRWYAKYGFREDEPDDQVPAAPTPTPVVTG